MFNLILFRYLIQNTLHFLHYAQFRIELFQYFKKSFSSQNFSKTIYLFSKYFRQLFRTSTIVSRHYQFTFHSKNRFNLRLFPPWRLSSDTSTLNLSALSSKTALRLARHHAQPLSSGTHSSELVLQSLLTSGVNTTSLLSSDVQTAYLSRNRFSEFLIPTPVPAVPAHVRTFSTSNTSSCRLPYTC